MRTLALLAGLFLLALLAQAEPPTEKAEDVSEEQQPEQEEVDMTISFEAAEMSGLQHTDQNVTCRCKFGSCRFPKIKSGTCYKNGKMARLCCG